MPRVKRFACGKRFELRYVLAGHIPNLEPPSKGMDNTSYHPSGGCDNSRLHCPDFGCPAGAGSKFDPCLANAVLSDSCRSPCCLLVSALQRERACLLPVISEPCPRRLPKLKIAVPSRSWPRAQPLPRGGRVAWRGERFLAASLGSFTRNVVFVTPTGNRRVCCWLTASQ